MSDWPWWARLLALAAALAATAYIGAGSYVEPFVRDAPAPGSFLVWAALAVVSMVTATVVLVRASRRSTAPDRARLKWALIAMSGAFAGCVIAVVFLLAPHVLSGSLGGGGRLTLSNWVMATMFGVVFPLGLGYAVLRERVVDVQFAVSRTLGYSLVSTLALVFIATVHWLIGRLIEHSGLAIGLEGAAAITLGLVLHRATAPVNGVVDRVLFREHHRAEQRLRRVIAALPFAADERSIADALVTEPVRNLDLASAALFYRESPEGELRRVEAHGWGEGHAEILPADHLLVRYLQADHDPLRLDDPRLLPENAPHGAALPALAIPVVNQHAVTAVALYGCHACCTLPDPDEVELLRSLALAAATAHQQVRIASLTRQIGTLKRESDTQRLRNEQLEALAGELRALVRARGGD